METIIDETFEPIAAKDLLLEVAAHLELALRPYALQIGKPVDQLDYEHLRIAEALLNALVRAQRRT